jgi:Putative esterase
VWSESRVFAGTNRRYWVYVPAQYTASEPASLMVFQDGHMYLDPEGEIRAAVVFDNLIHRGEVPVTIGVFVDPGEPENRNLEYDAFSDAYANFLLTEILPNIQDSYLIADDPDQWAIGGGSSGGNCAFTAAWMWPDRFRRVLSFLGSFAQLRGGNRYPELIQETPKKPLRVFLQAATRDLNWDAPEFNWFSANLRVAAPLPNVGTTYVSCSETAATTRTTGARSCQTHSAGSGDASVSEPYFRPKRDLSHHWSDGGRKVHRCWATCPAVRARRLPRG